MRYNHALALQHLGRQADAEAEMFKAHQVDPRDPGIVYVLAVLYVQERKWDQALPYAQKLIELMPGAPGPRQLLNQIQQLKQNPPRE